MSWGWSAPKISCFSFNEQILKTTLYHLRRFVVARHAPLAAIGGAVLLAQGYFDRFQPLGRFWPVVGVTCLLSALLLFRLLLAPDKVTAVASHGSGGSKGHDRAEQVARLESGLLALTLIYVAAQATGGPGSWVQPGVYLAVAYLVGFSARWVGALITLAVLGLQATLHLAAGEIPTNWTPLATQGGFIVLFALANMIFLQVEVSRRRKEHRRRLTAEIQAMRDEARDFRLVSPTVSSGEQVDRAEEEAKLARGAVEAIHQSMFFVLELLKKSLDLQTCVLLWLDSAGKRLRIKELVTDSNMVREVSISAHAGALGGVVKNRLLLNLRCSRRARPIPYYEGPEKVGAFLGAPVIQDGHLRGVLCGDRREDRPFTEAEEQLMLGASRQVLRAIQSERVFAAVERSKYEHERFYRASSMLNTALTLTQVYDTAIAAAQEIAGFDFGAITLVDHKRRKHIICRVLGHGRDKFEGQEFGANAGLVSMVVKNKHYLPAGGDLRERDTVVFTKKLRLKGIESLVVMPLIVQDTAIGTFVLASRERGQFSKRIREMLGVITNQVAISVENAKMYKQMEEMATTDGLTNLPNHRTFQARLSEMLYRAERHDKPVSVVLTDIDKFKLVNDTYGHPVGDAVLRRVSKVLADQVRKVDLVARYGGEEFAMVLEETDGAGAKLFCERVRQEIAAQVMSSDKGPFRVTISLGIASYPVDGRDKQLLIERADQALYAAKEGGRNKTVRYEEIRSQDEASRRPTGTDKGAG
jgi:two-component system cell cycle response regulator